MGTTATSTAARTRASSLLAVPQGAVAETSSIDLLIASELPMELQVSARNLLHAFTSKVAVAEHFDAFCGQAFSKPEWAAAASPVIAEIFDHDEDQLAELARIPDLIIEMGSGQATVTCMVASRWAARGETHRLSRLAESIVASHASKNACAVEVMLALAATLAVTRFSRAEQLYNAALPLAGEEHQEALADARRWLGAGRVVCSAAAEERDFWDVRLRKPKTPWLWQSKEELQLLDRLSERLTTSIEGAELFQAVLPACWWDLAMKSAQLQEKVAAMTKTAETAKEKPVYTPRVSPDTALPTENPTKEIQSYPKAGQSARFVLGWICGALAMAFTLIWLPPEDVYRVLNTFRASESRNTVPSSTFPASLKSDRTPAEMETWRKEHLQKMAADMAQFASQQAVATSSPWRDNEMVLSGHSQELPFESTQYMKFLVWLHLDPPKDDEVRMRVPKLLLDRVKADVIALWEELIYPGSSNADEIKNAAREALHDSKFQWNAQEKKRLGLIAGSEGGSKNLTTTSTRF